jgi:hypothetical protein
VQDSNGYSQRVSAGALFELGGGILWRLPERPLSLQLTANWHGDSAGTNSAVTFTRYPLEALAFYQPTDSMRFGLGMRYVLDPVSGARINNNTERIYFKNTIGTIVEAGYAIDKEDWLNLRLVWEKYQPYACSCGGGIVPVQSSPSVNGFHVGVNWVIHFGDRGESTTAPAAVAEPGPTESYGLLDLLFGTHTGASDEHRRREAHDGHRENKRKEEIVTRNVVITPDPAK